jgi:hypothetical protein
MPWRVEKSYFQLSGVCYSSRQSTTQRRYKLIDWTVIGSSADVVAALGVIITLLYLAIQIREQTKEARLSATRELARDWADGLRFISGDERNFELYQRAIVDYENLPRGDRIRAFMMLSSTFRAFELQHMHVSKGKFETDLFTGMEYRVRDLISLPGVRYFWQNNKQQFNAEFIRLVEEASPPKKQTGTDHVSR